MLKSPSKSAAGTSAACLVSLAPLVLAPLQKGSVDWDSQWSRLRLKTVHPKEVRRRDKQLPHPAEPGFASQRMATGKSSRENRWHGHGPASPHIPRASMQSTRAGSGAPSGEAKRRGPRRLGSRSRRSGRAHDRRRDCGFRASSSAWPRRGGGVATDRSTRHARALADRDINLAMVEIVVVDEFAIELPLLLKQRRRRLVEHLSLHQLLRSSNRQPKMPHKSR